MGLKSILDGKYATNTKEKTVQKVKKLKKDKNNSKNTNKKDSIDLTKFFSASPQSKADYFAISTSTARKKTETIVEDEEIFCED